MAKKDDDITYSDPDDTSGFFADQVGVQADDMDRLDDIGDADLEEQSLNDTADQEEAAEGKKEIVEEGQKKKGAQAKRGKGRPLKKRTEKVTEKELEENPELKQRLSARQAEKGITPIYFGPDIYQRVMKCITHPCSTERSLSRIVRRLIIPYLEEEEEFQKEALALRKKREKRKQKDGEG